MAKLTGGDYFPAIDGSSICPIIMDLAMILPYKVLATEAILINIFPSYLTEISNPTFVTPYEHIFKQDGKFDKFLSKDGTTTITWIIGTLVALEKNWTITFEAKFKPIVPMNLIKDIDRVNINSMLAYRDENDEPQQITIPLNQIELKGHLPGYFEYILADRTNSVIFGGLGFILIVLGILFNYWNISLNIELAFLGGILFIAAMYIRSKGGVLK